jgi:ATP-dependent 26S proteasome regulatory subunit
MSIENMSVKQNDNWQQTNQRYLTAALAVVRGALERHVSSLGDKRKDERKDDKQAQQALQEAKASMPAPAALDLLTMRFGLSTFERDVLLLCAGLELDSTFATLCANAQGDPQRIYPTFSLALATLSEPHWSAITPVAPLRHWRLIEVGSGNALTSSPLRIDESVLHYLAGVPHLDDRLAGMVEPVRSVSSLLPSQRQIAEQLAKTWANATKLSDLPIALLCGEGGASKRDIAVAACARLGWLNLHVLSAQALPTAPSELEAFLRLWEREASLHQSALLLDCDDVDVADALRRNAIDRFLNDMNSPLIVVCRERRRAICRRTVIFDIRRPSAGEQHAFWRSQLSAAAINVNGQADALASQFSLSAQTILAVCEEALVSREHEASGSNQQLSTLLWDLCRSYARPRIEELAQRLEPIATWEDLVLPELQMQILREIAAHVKQRAKVYETWGFANKGTRGLGISVLFAGASGTGKTMAAEVLANDLRLDLYRIDLSQVVSKYIGETEKNLRRVFDAAEEGGAILLFDEADALFGKRSEVKDSHDRYANIEISYLLQRMESYRGLAILTTNMKQALDSAFLRRIRFIVQFPFPDAAQRAEIWRRIFPASTPRNGLYIEKLAQLNVAGGNIRNIALGAAFLAADADEPVSMPHLLRAARSEYAKIEKSLTDAEVRGWV